MITVVIPTLNEKENLRNTISHTLDHAAFPEDLEIIVIDAGSKDGTLTSIEDLEVRVFSKPGFALRKYKSLNFGWEQSNGDTILFLDADTLLPQGFDSRIKELLKNEEMVGGAFEFSFRKPDWKLYLLTMINRLRYRFGKVYYGDQAIFVKRDALQSIGGVPQKPLMEAAYLCKELRKKGRLALVKPGIATSPRRFNTHGFFKVAWFDLNMFIRFNLGLPVSSYADKYWGKNLNS